MYGIKFVDRAALPHGRSFMFIDLDGDGALIYYREDAVTVENLEDSWTAFRALLAEPPPDDGVADVVPLARYIKHHGLRYAVPR